MGKGVLKAVANVNDKIAPALIGMDPTQQGKIDKVMLELDKTDNKVCNQHFHFFTQQQQFLYTTTKKIHRSSKNKFQTHSLLLKIV